MAFIYLIVWHASLQHKSPRPPPNPSATGRGNALSADDVFEDADSDDDTDFVLEEARRRAGRTRKGSTDTASAETASTDDASSSESPAAPAVADADTDTDVSGDTTDTASVAGDSGVDQTPGFFTPLAFSAVPGLSFPFASVTLPCTWA